jgi:hypothetical protein
MLRISSSVTNAADSEGIVESIEEQGQQDCDQVDGNEVEEDPYAYLQEDAEDDGAP